ncbi:hypothetical protein Taro_019475 [Colocasia esculenta]|uniref:C2H2-type domain-containing protein n=1 Tax=Colocasia esculenta TaxID=4460 RepID=A0A843UZB8_COLES|nr:hypothetical protein [Colocasia esculenta]
MDNPNLHGFFLGLPNPEPSLPSISVGVDKLPDANTGSSTQPRRGWKKGLKDAPVRLHGHLAGVPKPKFKRKPAPDPSSAHATAPCSECGKRFWSQKALFGHMRCHPERQWRGINPPPHLRRSLQGSSGTPRSPPLQRPHLTFGAQQIFHDVELEAATYLLMLANGPSPADAPRAMAGMDGPMGRFEWSGCTTLFGLQQAPSGQLPALKKTTSFAAVIRNEGKEELSGISCGNNSSPVASGGINSGRRAAEGMVMMVSDDGRHGASSSSGQALEERPSGRGYVPDLNFPPPIDNVDSST